MCAWQAEQSKVWACAKVPADSDDDQEATEAEWRWFCGHAEAAMRRAAKCYGSLRDPPGRRAKGTTHQAQPVSAKAHHAGKKGTFALRRMLKLQGRVR